MSKGYMNHPIPPGSGLLQWDLPKLRERRQPAWVMGCWKRCAHVGVFRLYSNVLCVEHATSAFLKHWINPLHLRAMERILKKKAKEAEAENWGS